MLERGDEGANAVISYIEMEATALLDEAATSLDMNRLVQASILRDVAASLRKPSIENIRLNRRV